MSFPAVPDIELLITFPGGAADDFTPYLAYSGAGQQMTISQNFGRQGDTATIVLVDDWQGQPHPHIFVEVESQILLYDHTAGQSLFAGVITNPTLNVDGANRNEWYLQCTDYTYYADNAYVEGTFNGYTIDQIIIALTRQANCGISADTVANGGFITPAPSLTTYSIDWTKLSDVWRSLAQLASSSTAYGWYVDDQKRLHFADATTAINSGVTFTTSPSAGSLGSLTEGHTLRGGNFSYEWDGTTIHNRILVRGANQTITSKLTGPATGTWRGDGFQDSWGLKFTVTGTPTLKLNGVKTKLAVVQAGQSSTDTWQVTQNANGQWYLTTTTAPKSGTVIKLWYDYQIPITAQANDTQSQAFYTGPNRGVFTEYIQDSTLTTPSMALARAQREKTEYAFAVERVTFDTDESFFGYLRAGQTFHYVNFGINDAQNANSWGLNDTFLAISNAVNFTDGGYRSMTITGVRV